MPSGAAGLEATGPWRIYPAQRLALLVPVAVLVELGILRRGFSVARSHPGVLSAGGHGLAGPHQLHAEVPLVAEVEQEEELLLARRARQRHLTDASPARGAGPGAIKDIRGAVQGILGGAVPWLATQEKRPEVRVIEAEREGDRFPEGSQRLIRRDLDL